MAASVGVWTLTPLGIKPTQGAQIARLDAMSLRRYDSSPNISTAFPFLNLLEVGCLPFPSVVRFQQVENQGLVLPCVVVVVRACATNKWRSWADANDWGPVVLHRRAAPRQFSRVRRREQDQPQLVVRESFLSTHAPFTVQPVLQ
jgi:hypothetical protein